MNFGEHIKALRLQKQWTQDYVCSKLNISAGALSRYETGMYEPKSLSLVKDFADLYGVSVDYLLDNENVEDSLETVPIVGLITAGQPILATESIEGYLPIDPTIYGKKNVKDLFFLKVKGNSMNLKVKDGDYALIHKQEYAENDDIIVAIVNGDDEATLKRYKRLNEQFVMLEPMSSENFEPIMVDLKTTKLNIIGKMIGYFGRC